MSKPESQSEQIRFLFDECKRLEAENERLRLEVAALKAALPTQ
jgi:hypothetical protein